MEFFELFFIGFYGREMPAKNVMKARASKFKGAKMDWYYDFYQNDENKFSNSPCHIIDMKGLPNKNFSGAYIKDAYGQFDFLDYKQTKANVYSEGRYFVDRETGMLEQATYNNFEIIDEKLLYSKNQYTIKTY